MASHTKHFGILLYRKQQHSETIISCYSDRFSLAPFVQNDDEMIGQQVSFHLFHLSCSRSHFLPLIFFVYRFFLFRIFFYLSSSWFFVRIVFVFLFFLSFFWTDSKMHYKTAISYCSRMWIFFSNCLFFFIFFFTWIFFLCP